MNIYVSILFIDYSSAFNTIVPSKLITKLRILGLNNFCHADPQHWGSKGVRAQSPPVLPVHS
jgi:hypothetical protein